MSGREHGHEPLLPHSAEVSTTVHTPLPADDGQGRPSLDGKDDNLEVVPGFERENLQGWIPELATEADVRAVVEKAFDYRGDVTITRRDGAQVTGYLFDRRIGKTLNDSFIRVMLPPQHAKTGRAGDPEMLAASNERPAIPYCDIAAIAFTGRDTAAGKTYEAWVKKYWEKREKGEKNISIEPEALE